MAPRVSGTRQWWTAAAALLIAGSRGFPKATLRAASTNAAPPAIADLDGDGRMELVWVDWGRNVYVWDIPGTPGAHHVEWPMARHDPGHTGVRPLTP